MSKKVYHNPQGDPCAKCGKALLRHRVDHAFVGSEVSSVEDACVKCGLPARRHRERGYREEPIEYIGIDGEGQGRKDHRYVLLAASNESGTKKWTAKPEPGNDDRLTSEQCLNLILGLPTKRTKVFSFSFNYDLTKMLQDLPDESLYLLFRPNLRACRACHFPFERFSLVCPKCKEEHRPPPMVNGKPNNKIKPIKWNGFYLSLQGTKFSVRKRGTKVIIWDLFKFFQSKFVNALKDWKVGNPELWDRMSKMKDKRDEFDTIYLETKCPECGADPKVLCEGRKKSDPHISRYEEGEKLVLNYCLEECACIAELARRLVEAHAKAELKLKSFYGAGSSGAAMLTALGIKEHVRQPHPDMKRAVASAFFGGRFENSIIGQVDGNIYNRDISSAYPYHTTFLPCLEHGKWTHTHKRDELDGKKASLVRYGLGSARITSWGPFPFRTDEGSISFPISSGGGWVWLEEYLAGERIFPNVQFKEAWVYHTECDCQPFKRVPEYYVLRLQIGKEGPGLVIKLGVNSIYGKLAQSVGNAIFNCWIWAGMVTSGCRAQVLDMLGLHKDWRNLLAIATDGIFTRELLDAPLPRETGTGLWLPDDKGRLVSKPLGGWESKTYDQGMFFARPGIYFPLNPTKENIKDIKGRGVGKGVVLENWALIMDAWKTNGLEGIARIAEITRFCGAKTSVSHSSQGYRRAVATDGRSPSYGQWISRKVEMSFRPMPKRQEMNDDGTLKLRTFPKTLESVPYARAMRSREALEMEMAMTEALEQPDGDLTDYEEEMVE